MARATNKSTGQTLLPLFDPPPRIAPAYGFQGTNSKIKWSYSRRQALGQCPLAYYYRYYGANNNTAKGEPLKEKLHFLKSLSNRHMRTGNILHLVIGTYLKRKKAGDESSLQWALNWANKIYNEDYAFSRAYHQGSAHQSEGKYPPVLLEEFYYGLTQAEELWQESKDRLLAAINTALSNPATHEFLLGGAQADAYIEQSFPLKSPDFTIDAKPDLVFRAPTGRIKIADWKIGQAGSSEDSLQLFSYAMAVSERLSCLPEEIEVCLIHLGDLHLGNEGIINYSISGRQLLRAKARILQDIEKMKLLDEFGKAADSAAFTPCRQQRICTNCVFREACPFVSRAL
jgi:hypothetical protein